MLNKCGSADALLAESFADVPAEVHQVDTFQAESTDTGDTSRGVSPKLYSAM